MRKIAFRWGVVIISLVAVDRLLALRIRDLKGDVRVLEAQIDKLDVEELRKIKEEFERLKVETNLRREAKARRREILSFLRHISESIPSSRKRNLIQLNSIKVVDSKFKVEGIALTKSSFRRFLKKLAKKMEVYPVSLVEERVGKKTIVQKFRIEGKL